MFSNENRGGEDDDQAFASVGHDDHLLDDLRADDYVLGGASDDDETFDWAFSDSSGIVDSLLRRRHSRHARNLRSRHHAPLPQNQGHAR